MTKTTLFFISSLALLSLYFGRFFIQKPYTLPIDQKFPCVYQLFGDGNKQIGVASYRGKGQWMSARHVLEMNTTKELRIGRSSDQIIGLLKNTLNIGNDIGLFELQARTGDVGIFNEHSCDLSFNGLITYISGEMKKVPLDFSGTFIHYDPNYGQSGSPIFSGGRIIGLISRKYDDGAIVSLID